MADVEEDMFVSHGRHSTAAARQLFRAYRSRDPEAVGTCLFYLSDHLVKVLTRHLTLPRHLSPAFRWNVKDWQLVSLLAVEVDIALPRRLRIPAAIASELAPNRFDFACDTRGAIPMGPQVCEVVDYPAGTQWYEPFVFDLLLRPDNGMFQGYQFRLGDQRPIGEKIIGPRSHSTIRGSVPQCRQNQEEAWAVVARSVKIRRRLSSPLGPCTGSHRLVLQVRHKAISTGPTCSLQRTRTGRACGAAMPQTRRAMPGKQWRTLPSSGLLRRPAS